MTRKGVKMQTRRRFCRAENFGRTGGMFGMVFAQKSNHEATKGAKEEEEIETADRDGVGTSVDKFHGFPMFPDNSGL